MAGLVRCVVVGGGVPKARGLGSVQAASTAPVALLRGAGPGAHAPPRRVAGRQPRLMSPNDRWRQMLIGYARVSKTDGSQSLDPQLLAGRRGRRRRGRGRGWSRRRCPPAAGRGAAARRRDRVEFRPVALHDANAGDTSLVLSSPARVRVRVLASPGQSSRVPADDYRQPTSAVSGRTHCPPPARARSRPRVRKFATARRGAAEPFDQLEQVLGRGVGQLAHPEVVDDEQGHARQLGQVVLASLSERRLRFLDASRLLQREPVVVVHAGARGGVTSPGG